MSSVTKQPYLLGTAQTVMLKNTNTCIHVTVPAATSNSCIIFKHLQLLKQMCYLISNGRLWHLCLFWIHALYQRSLAVFPLRCLTPLLKCFEGWKASLGCFCGTLVLYLSLQHSGWMLKILLPRRINCCSRLCFLTESLWLFAFQVLQSRRFEQF